MLLWVSVMAAAASASLVGYVALGQSSDVVIGGVQAFAAGAIIRMLADTMMAQAGEKGGPIIGLVTAVGFMVSFLLSRAWDARSCLRQRQRWKPASYHLGRDPPSIRLQGSKV